MDGDAAFLFMGSYDSLVHAGTVHTFTTELGKEGRMNIYYFIRIIMQKWHQVLSRGSLPVQ